MDKKQLIAAFVGFAVTLLVGAVTWSIARVGQGETALEDAHIREVVEEVIEEALILPDGTTLGATVLEIKLVQANMVGQLKILTE